MRNNKLKQLIKLANMTEQEVEKLDYKEKQKHYSAKSKLCRVVHNSKAKNGKGITYKKSKESDK